MQDWEGFVAERLYDDQTERLAILPCESLGWFDEPEFIEAETPEQAQEFFNLLKTMRSARFKQQGRRDMLCEAPFA